MIEQMNGMTISKTISKKYIFSLLIAFVLIGCGTNEAIYDEVQSSKVDEDNKEVQIRSNDNDGADEEEKIYVDWQRYENQICTEDLEDFQEYTSVLNNENTFYCFNWLDKDITFSEYLESIESEEQPSIAGMALVDIDNQNGKELVIHLYEGGGNYLVLTRDDGKFYGTNLGERLFEELQNDGKYLASGGAGDLYFHTMSIDSDGVIENKIGELHGKENEDGSITDELEVDGVVVDDAQKWVDENYSDPVSWIE